MFTTLICSCGAPSLSAEGAAPVLASSKIGSPKGKSSQLQKSLIGYSVWLRRAFYMGFLVRSDLAVAQACFRMFVSSFGPTKSDIAFCSQRKLRPHGMKCLHISISAILAVGTAVGCFLCDGHFTRSSDRWRMARQLHTGREAENKWFL